MEDRLLRLLDTEQISSSKFADIIGVQRSSVSHILSGRNKPSFDFLQKTLKAFPLLNADWLMLGEGKMYDGDTAPGPGSLFSQAIEKSSVSTDIPDSKEEKDTELSPVEDNISENNSTEAEKSIAASDFSELKTSDASGSSKFVKRIIVLYSDNTFESYDQA